MPISASRYIAGPMRRPILRPLPVALATFVLACSSEPLEKPKSEVVAETRALLVFDRVHLSSDPEAEHFQRASSWVDFGFDPVERATLSVDLESPCFPFDNWTPDSIPEGHNWPRLCDAFDRTLLLSLDDPEDAATEPPGIELVRAITPFGGPMRFHADVTDIVNGLPGTHQLRVDITTYGDAGGQVTGSHGEWIVSSVLTLEPGAAPRKVLAVEPLLFGFVTEAASTPVTFRVPPGATSARLEYRATGHGGVMPAPGCIGPAEEFCPRTHSLLFDGAALDEFSPWRNDCAMLCTPASFESEVLRIPEYCAENPCGAPESVRAPRANWCPGSVTPPRVSESGVLAAPGEHEFALAIDRVEAGGLWLVSATYFAFE
jgi:hypothetical protein